MQDKQLLKPIELFIEKVAKVESDITELESLGKMQKKYGILNFGKLIQDDLMSLGRENGKIIPFKTYYHCIESNQILIGQLNSNNELQGIGKKITPWSVIEGYFEDNQLKGLGRHLRNDGTYCVGNFSSDLRLRGYGKRIVNGEEVEVGQWDEVNIKSGKSVSKDKITKFNPNVDLCSREIDFEDYETEVWTPESEEAA